MAHTTWLAVSSDLRALEVGGGRWVGGRKVFRSTHLPLRVATRPEYISALGQLYGRFTGHELTVTAARKPTNTSDTRAAVQSRTNHSVEQRNILCFKKHKY